MASLTWTTLEANALLREHGLADQGWRFTFDNARNRGGVCKYGPRVISMSRYLVQLWDEEEVRQTLLHEVAHALTPGAHHGYAWQRKAAEIGFTRGTRTHSNETVPGRWLAICDHCGTEAGRMHRLTKARREGSLHTACRKPVRWVDTGTVRV